MRLRPLLQPVLDRTAASPHFTRNSTGPDPASLVSDALGLLAGGTLSRKELARRLAERHPGRDGRILALPGGAEHPLVHGAATGAWGSWGNRSAVSVTPADAWLGRPMAVTASAAAARESAKELIRRYLAAFGPAGVKDAQAWCGLTRLGEVVAEMRGELRRYRDPDGRELFDLAEAELPEPGTPAPVRLLPAFDNVLLGHADRTRVISDEDRKHVMPGQARVRPTFLVDGRVHGTWSLDAGDTAAHPAPPARRSRPGGPGAGGGTAAAVRGRCGGELVVLSGPGAAAQPRGRGAASGSRRWVPSVRHRCSGPTLLVELCSLVTGVGP